MVSVSWVTNSQVGATASVYMGGITSVQLTNSGSGYTTPPTVTVSGPTVRKRGPWIFAQKPENPATDPLGQRRELPIGALIHFQAVATELGADVDQGLKDGGLTAYHTFMCLSAMAPPAIYMSKMDMEKIKILHGCAKRCLSGGANIAGAFTKKEFADLEALFRVCIAHNLNVGFEK